MLDPSVVNTNTVNSDKSRPVVPIGASLLRDTNFITTFQSTQITLPDNIFARLIEYADLFKIDASKLVSRYARCPFYYSLDTVIAVGNDPTKAIFTLSGKLGKTSGSSKTFGYTYFHAGTVLTQDSLQKSHLKRTTIYGISPEIFKSFIPELAVEWLDSFLKIASLAIHDPLHSLKGDKSNIDKYDRHLRYGGLEFAPVAVHSVLIQTQLRSYLEMHEQLSKACKDFVHTTSLISVDNCSDSETLKKKMYAVSIVLRNLLIILPASHSIVQGFLDEANNKLFESKTRNVRPDRWKKFLHRDFSEGSHVDPIPKEHQVHNNSTHPYHHGAQSMLRPWLSKTFAQYFGNDMDTNNVLDYSTYLLLDTLIRGHGIFAIPSCLESSEIDLKELNEVFYT